MLVVPLYEPPVDTVTGSVGASALSRRLGPSMLRLKLGMELCTRALQDDVAEKVGEITWEREGRKKGTAGIVSP